MKTKKWMEAQLSEEDDRVEGGSSGKDVMCRKK